MKSTYTVIIDFLRYMIIIGFSLYFILLIWEWNWVVGIISAIPIYVILLNIIGFITLPLYALSPENRQKKREFDDFKDEYLN